MMKSQSLKWEFYQGKLPDKLVESWNNNIREAKNAVASSYFCFNHNTELLFRENTASYAVAFEQNEKNTHNLAAVIPFRKNQTSHLGFRVNLIENIHHNHLDMWYPFISERLSPDDVFLDFFKALKSEVKNWDYFFAEKVIFRGNTKLECVDDTYQQLAAYFCLKSVNEISELVSKKLLKNTKRLEKRLCKELNNNELSLKIFNQPDSVKSALEIFMQLESSGWKGAAGSAIALSDELTQFYHANWSEYSKSSNAEIIILMSNEKPIAGSIAFRQSNKRYLHKIAYDDKYASHGAGAILVRYILEESIKDTDIKEICFNTNPGWLHRWHPETHSLMAIREFNHSFKGKLLRYYFQVIRYLKFTKRKLFPKKA